MPPTAWLTVCTPPSCRPTMDKLEHTRRTSRLPVVVLERLEGRVTSMGGRSRTRKLAMIRDYLRSEEGRRWEWIVYADALDVIPGSGSALELQAELRLLGASDGRLVVSAEAACWLGVPCSDEAIRAMRRLAPEHFAAPHALFPCSGQYAGSRAAVLRFVEWGLAALAASAESAPVLQSLAKDGEFDDQGLLIAYWLAERGAVIVDRDARLFGNLARWYVLQSELKSRRESTYATRDVPWCSELSSGPRRFYEGYGHYCSDAFNLDGFEQHCAADGRCDLRYAQPGRPTLQPLLGWHGPGHNGKTLFRPLWHRLRNRPAWANASALATPRAGVCGVTSTGEGDCQQGWWGAWRGADFGFRVGQENCLALCALCPRCAFISWSLQADDCSWYAQCAVPLQPARGFQTVAAPWSVAPAAPARKMRHGRACVPHACAAIETEANCSFAPPRGKGGGRGRRGRVFPRRRLCSPHILRQHAPTTTGTLQQWLTSCGPGCPATHRAAAAAEAALRPADSPQGRACRPLASERVHLWTMVSVMQNELLDHCAPPRPASERQRPMHARDAHCLAPLLLLHIVLRGATVPAQSCGTTRVSAWTSRAALSSRCTCRPPPARPPPPIHRPPPTRRWRSWLHTASTCGAP